MITTKTLPLVLKAATATMPASVVGQRPTIAMVTAINNNQKAVLSTDAQSAPVNLQTTNKVTGPGPEAVQIVAKNTVTLVSVSCVCPADMCGFGLQEGHRNKKKQTQQQQTHKKPKSQAFAQKGEW